MSLKRDNENIKDILSLEYSAFSAQGIQFFDYERDDFSHCLPSVSEKKSTHCFGPLLIRLQLKQMLEENGYGKRKKGILKISFK